MSTISQGSSEEDGSRVHKRLNDTAVYDFEESVHSYPRLGACDQHIRTTPIISFLLSLSLSLTG